MKKNHYKQNDHYCQRQQGMDERWVRKCWTGQCQRSIIEWLKVACKVGQVFLSEEFRYFRVDQRCLWDFDQNSGSFIHKILHTISKSSPVSWLQLTDPDLRIPKARKVLAKKFTKSKFFWGEGEEESFWHQWAEQKSELAESGQQKAVKCCRKHHCTGS